MFDEAALQRDARRAYELGRLRTALFRSLFVLVPTAIVAVWVGGRMPILWLPMTALAWIFAHWRGGAVLRGSRIGLVGGIATFLLPMTVLRPCCSPEAMAQGMSCCTQPSACVVAGGLLGVALAAFVPSGRLRWPTAGGLMLGVASVAILRCSTLFGAEALGLIGGLLGGVVVTTLTRTMLVRRRSA